MIKLFLHYMKNIVLKAGLITLAALAGVGILVFSLWILISPQSMATVSEKIGNYGFAVTCADLKYKYSGDSYDLARCVEDSIAYSAGSDDKTDGDKLIIKYGEQLIDKADFDAVCRSRDEDISSNWIAGENVIPNYHSYIIGNLSAAQYRSTGNLDKAIATANRGKKIEYFTRLVDAVIKSNNKQDIEKIQTDSELPLYVQEYVKGVMDFLSSKK